MSSGMIIWASRAGLVIACTAFGLACGNLYGRRVEFLTALSQAMSRFRTQIMEAQPLAPALFVSEFQLFADAGLRMKRDVGLSAEDAFTEALAASPKDMPLSNEDIAVIAHFISLISRAAREDQAALFDEASVAIDSQLAMAKSDKEKNTQLCRTMGCLGGLALMLLTL